MPFLSLKCSWLQWCRSVILDQIIFFFIQRYNFSLFYSGWEYSRSKHLQTNWISFYFIFQGVTCVAPGECKIVELLCANPPCGLVARCEPTCNVCIFQNSSESLLLNYLQYQSCCIKKMFFWQYIGRFSCNFNFCFRSNINMEIKGISKWNKMIKGILKWNIILYVPFRQGVLRTAHFW